MPRRPQTLDPPPGGWITDGVLDIRNSDGSAPFWFDEVGNTVSTVRNFFYHTPGIRNNNLRRRPRDEIEFFEAPPKKQRTKMPRRSFSGLIKRYNTRRLTALRSRARPATTPYRPRSTIRKRFVKKRSFRRSKGVFSSKGITVYDKQTYTLDRSDSIRHPGYESGSAFATQFLRNNKTEGTSGYWYMYEFIGGNYLWQHAFAQIVTNANYFTNYTSGMMNLFDKYKINRITLKFKFPDQAASTTNSQFPTAMWVHRGAQYDVKFANTTPNATIPGTVASVLTLPGWKKYNLKRMNQVTVSFVPRIINNLESGTVAGGVQDVNTTTKNRYLPTTSMGHTVALVGPAICFEFPNSFSSASSSQPANSSMWSSSVAGTFLLYSTVEATAQICYKNPNINAQG